MRQPEAHVLDLHRVVIDEEQTALGEAELSFLRTMLWLAAAPSLAFAAPPASVASAERSALLDLAPAAPVFCEREIAWHRAQAGKLGGAHAKVR